MAIPLHSASGSGLFDRWGKQIGGLNEAVSYQGATSNAREQSIQALFQTTDQNVISNLPAAVTGTQTAQNTIQTELYTEIQNTLIQMAIDDGIGISPQSLQAALLKLISQMTSSNSTITRPSLSKAVTPGASNVGNGVVTCSFINPFDGKQFDYLFAETITLTCTQSGYPQGGAVSGQEPFSVVGGVAVPTTQWNWPQGSGVSTSLNAVNASATGGIVTDGDFETWSGSPATLTNWTRVTGTYGTSIVQGAGASQVYTGSFSLSFVGQAVAENTQINQVLTITGFAPNSTYAFNCFMKVASLIGSGVVSFSLIDQNGNVVNDNAGNPNTISVNASGLTTTFAAQNGHFRTPANLPTGITLRVQASTSLPNGGTVYVDHLMISGAQTPVYTGGPYLTCFSGSIGFAVSDSFSAVLTSSQSPQTFSCSLNRSMSLASLGNGYKIPSAQFGSLSDQLIG